MAKMTIAGSIQNTRNNVTDADGYALPPLAANLKEGQIAVNTCETDPCIFFKTSEGKIVKIVSEEKLTKALTDILGNSAADLDTLRELIAQFEGSANDILPMLVALTDRVTAAESALSNKVTKETGKGLSTNDYTTQEKTKLSGIAAGAQVNTVTSVAGKTGAVTLVPSDCGALAADGTAVAATKATFVGAIPLGNYLGKTVDEVKTAIVKCVETNGGKGTFYIELNTYGESFLNNWDRPTHVLTAGNTLTYIKVTCGTNSKYAHLEFTSYNDKYIYTSFINAGNFGALRRVMHTDDTAVAATKLETKRKINGVDFDGTSDIVSNRVYANVIPNETDYNTLTTGGWYHCPGGGAASTMINCPTSITHSLLVTASVSSRVAQVIYDYYGQSYSRFWKGADDWTEWVMMYHTGNINLPTVPLVCNTLTSTFGILIQADNHFRPLNFVRGDNSGTIGVGDDGSLLLRKEAKGVANADLRIFSDNITYNTNTIYHAGNSNKADVDWTAANLSLPVDGSKINFYGGIFVGKERGRDLVLGGGIYNNVAVKVTDNYYTVYNEGNSNKSDVDWTCKQLKATSGFSEYTADGLFDVKATPAIIQTPSTAQIRLGYWDSGSGLYAPRIGFEMGDKLWSTGISGADGGFHIGRGNYLGNSDIFIDSITGNVGIGTINPTKRLDVNGEAIFGFTNNRRITIESGNILFNTTIGGWAQALEIKNKDASQSASFGFYGNNEDINYTYNGFGSYTDSALKVWKDNKVTINKGGTAPTEVLDVGGNITLGTTTTGTTEKPHWTKLDFKGYYGIYGRIQSRDRSINNCDGLMQFLVRADSGAATNVEPQLVLSLNSDKSAEFQGNGLFNGNVTAKGDVVAKSTNAVVFSTSDAAAGATRLNDLVDVKLPTTLSAKMVLAYDPAQVNSDGSKGGYTFMPSAGTGTGKVSSTEIASLPDHNHNDIVYASDERLKENVIPLRNATIMLNNLRPKEYNWNETGIKLGLRDPKAYGLIAQEVEGLREIIDLVKPMHGGESGYLGVDYVKLVPVLIAGFQEQHKEIIALNQKLKTIQARANKAYGNETNNADEIANLKADNITLKAEIEELKMLIKK